MKPKKERLLMLARKLEGLARSKRKDLPKFALHQWGYQRPERKGQNPTQLSCATAACAVGTAMLMPEFRKQGLGCKVRSDLLMIPKFRGYENWEAVDKFFFGVKSDSFVFMSPEAKHLFEEDSYPVNDRTGKRGLKAVAARIRAFVKVGGIPASR